MGYGDLIMMKVATNRHSLSGNTPPQNKKKTKKQKQEQKPQPSVPVSTTNIVPTHKLILSKWQSHVHTHIVPARSHFDFP